MAWTRNTASTLKPLKSGLLVSRYTSTSSPACKSPCVPGARVSVDVSPSAGQSEPIWHAASTSAARVGMVDSACDISTATSHRHVLPCTVQCLEHSSAAVGKTPSSHATRNRLLLSTAKDGRLESVPLYGLCTRLTYPLRSICTRRVHGSLDHIPATTRRQGILQRDDSSVIAQAGQLQ